MYISVNYENTSDIGLLRVFTNPSAVSDEKRLDVRTRYRINNDVCDGGWISRSNVSKWT